MPPKARVSQANLPPFLDFLNLQGPTHVGHRDGICLRPEEVDFWRQLLALHEQCVRLAGELKVGRGGEGEAKAVVEIFNN